MTGPHIEAQGLCYAYPDGTSALDSVSFSIPRGECVGLVGANGAGKSTLLMLLAGLAFARSGTISLGGEVVERRSLASIRRKLGFVFQDPDDQLFMTTVRDDVAFGPRNMGLPPEEVAERCAQALATVGIPHLAGRPPFRLSGGEKRAAALASILSMEPEALALDEPTAALDPRARRRLIGILGGLPQTRLVATHDIDLVYELCDRVIVLSGGRIAAFGPTDLVVGDEALMERAGLEPPLALQACPRCGGSKAASRLRASASGDEDCRGA
ncbi:MAG TPA: ABC transporter ATP-binding protein [Spirochaetia bacterium]|nr:ABC transporter ATP-binding protein [Spirochaetia bacterium]